MATFWSITVVDLAKKSRDGCAMHIVVTVKGIEFMHQVH